MQFWVPKTGECGRFGKIGHFHDVFKGIGEEIELRSHAPSSSWRIQKSNYLYLWIRFFEV